MVRPADYVRIQHDAIRAGMSLSEYVRARLLRERVTFRQTRKLDPAVFDQLRRIGVNLNQAVYKFHASGQAPPELVSAAAAVERFLLNEIEPGGTGDGS